MEDVIEGKDYSFPKEEEKILGLWAPDKLDAFQEQLRQSEGRPEYSFYDGPPFATGLPHYGHLLAGTLKVCSCFQACQVSRFSIRSSTSLMRVGGLHAVPLSCVLVDVDLEALFRSPSSSVSCLGP